MSTETEMIFRLREERQQAEKRALEYAKYADKLQKALVHVSCSQYLELTDIRDFALDSVRQAEAEFDHSLFTSAGAEA